MMETLAEISTSLISLFNIPLIMNIRKRKCSCEISLVWAVGIWLCALLLLIASLVSGNFTFKMIAGVNLLIFTVTVLYILRYHHIKAIEEAPEHFAKALCTLGERSIVEGKEKGSYLYFVD